MTEVKEIQGKLKKFVEELRTGAVSSETKEQTRKVFETIDTDTLQVVEQHLINEGLTHEEIKKSLCDIHLEVLKDNLAGKGIKVQAPHPVNTFMEEHVEILESLNELKSLVERLKDKESFESLGNDIEKLQDIAHHLVEAESHHQREEETLFSRLEKHNVIEPVEVMISDHIEFKSKKQKLYNVAYNWEKMEFNDFKKNVLELGQYIANELEKHIFKEDNIVYQIALQTFSDKEWKNVKKECDKIGYCCFTPDDQES